MGPAIGGRLPPGAAAAAGMVNNIDPMLAGVTNQLKDTTIGGGLPPGALHPPPPGPGVPPGMGGPLGPLGGGVPMDGLVPGDSGRNRFLASRRFVGVTKDACMTVACLPRSLCWLGEGSTVERSLNYIMHKLAHLCPLVPLLKSLKISSKALAIWNQLSTEIHRNPLANQAANQTLPAGGLEGGHFPNYKIEGV